ncbi:hypothetical protein N5J43_21910 [Pseudomonas nicosulfuronedens]|uniref:hypothetical protein n=1 Tax=Pseudomonas TaxID=286 RepID=UPI00148611CC|nr:hypothetical protein [Pseudomonas nicosulfuronedens]MDH1981621.1 hypothetical protein [Pseudomonas nicosulfuronedens]
MQKLLLADRRVAVRKGCGNQAGGRFDLAPCVLSAHLTGQRPGQMSDCFFDFLATTTHAPAWARKPEAESEWLKMENMKVPLREMSDGYC